MAKAQQLAGGRAVEVAAGDVGGQVLAAGLVDEVRMDVVPVVLGSGKRYFGSVDAQHLLEQPDAVIQGNRVLHLRYQVRRLTASPTLDAFSLAGGAGGARTHDLTDYESAALTS